MRWLFYLLAWLVLIGETRAESDEARFLAGLRERQLYDLAEKHVNEQWRREDLSDNARAELAIQLALVYTEQALTAAPESRDALWAKADGACAALINGWPDNPRRRLVEVQRALVLLARGQQAREADDLGTALDQLRTAIPDLAAGADDVSRELIELRLRPQNRRPPEALGIEDLESLHANISYQLARAERQIGLCHRPGTADRDDALLQAARRLAPLAQQTPPDDLVWSARVELVACQRELGQGSAAQKLVEAWLHENPPTQIVALLSADYTEEHHEPQPVADAFQAAMTAAAKEHKAGRFAAAAERYRRLAMNQPDHPRAAETHRLAILSTADLLRDTAPANRPPFARSYEALLQEHLDQWPEQAASDDVRLWHGRLLAGRRDWPAAIAVLQQVRPAAKNLADSVTLLADCYDNQLRQLDAREEQGVQARTRLLADATRFLQPIITGPDNRWPESWSDLQRDTALNLARLHLRHSDQPSQYAEQLLKAALRGTTAVKGLKADEIWHTTARSLLVAALARNGKTAEAQAIVNQLAGGPPEALLDTLATVYGLLTEAMSTGGDEQPELGQLALAIVQVLDAQRSELDDSVIARLDRYRATAVAGTGDRAAALTQYAALAAQSPDDGDIQQRYAALLAASDSREDLRQALARWQQVEARSRRGGDRWRRARQARIELLTRLGEKDEAEKLVRLTRLLYPDWDTESAGSTAP